MAAISHVFTLSRAAERLGIGDDLLAQIAGTLEPEDGVLWVHDNTDDGCYGFTKFGLENAQEILNDEVILASIAERTRPYSVTEPSKSALPDRDQKLHGAELVITAKYVSASKYDEQHFHVSFDTEDPAADIDLSAPLQPYLVIQRQFEDYGGGVCYIETHEPDKYAGHYRLRLIEFTPTRLLFEIDRASNKTVDVRFAVDQDQFQELQSILAEIFSGSFTPP